MTEEMTEHSVLHSSFTLEKDYQVEVGRVFAAWTHEAHKAVWFAPAPARYSLDFRVGGSEHVVSPHPGGGEISFDGVYNDIVPNRRIVYTGVLSAGGRVSTVSITTVEFEASSVGTRLVLTEQDTYLDGQEQPEWREQGTSDWLDRLGIVVDGTVSGDQEVSR
ncbi:MAG: SRPBCC domain-containing protein [Humibacter sp.]